jgi:hypothetical protein
MQTALSEVWLGELVLCAFVACIAERFGRDERGMGGGSEIGRDPSATVDSGGVVSWDLLRPNDRADRLNLSNISREGRGGGLSSNTPFPEACSKSWCET